MMRTTGAVGLRMRQAAQQTIQSAANPSFAQST
jgi:hypothetical protein